MRLSAFLIGTLFAAEAAIACVCVGPLTAEERRQTASRIATAAAAIAEVELAEPLDYQAMRAELYRVHKVHVGSAPAQFRLERDFSRSATGEVQTSMTSCDVIPPSGERTLVVLYASRRVEGYRIGGTCDHLFVNSPGAIELILEESRKIRSVERA